MLHNATESSFRHDVLESSVPVLVDFWAEWCAPCRAMHPILEALAEKYDGRLKVVKVDADSNRELVKQHGVRGLPTLMLVVNGEIKGLRAGAMPLTSVESFMFAAEPNQLESLLN
jgi:thioredoxin